MFFYFAKKIQVKTKIFKKHKKDHVGFNHGFNVEKKKIVTTVFLRSFQSFSFIIHVFSCHYYTLSSNKCKLSSSTYKLSSKIIIIFCFVAKNGLQTMGHIEIILNFVTYFCCYNTAVKSKLFSFQCFGNIFLCCFKQQKSF